MTPEQLHVGPLLAALLAAYLMVQAGVAKQLLQWKRKPRCPFCGHNQADCRCRRRIDQ